MTPTNGPDERSGPRVDRIGGSLRRFLAESIGTVERLEILLLLRRQSDRYWDARAVSHRLDLESDLAAASLEALARHNLLDVRLTDTIRYRFAPATAEQRTHADRTAALWRESRESVVRALSGARRSLADFSDAFRLGKPEDGRG